jgi:hypothetical protein
MITVRYQAPATAGGQVVALVAKVPKLSCWVRWSAAARRVVRKITHTSSSRDLQNTPWDCAFGRSVMRYTNGRPSCVMPDSVCASPGGGAFGRSTARDRYCTRSSRQYRLGAIGSCSRPIMELSEHAPAPGLLLLPPGSLLRLLSRTADPVPRVAGCQ